MHSKTDTVYCTLAIPSFVPQGQTVGCKKLITWGASTLQMLANRYFQTGLPAHTACKRPNLLYRIIFAPKKYCHEQKILNNHEKQTGKKARLCQIYYIRKIIYYIQWERHWLNLNKLRQLYLEPEEPLNWIMIKLNSQVSDSNRTWGKNSILSLFLPTPVKERH